MSEPADFVLSSPQLVVRGWGERARLEVALEGSSLTEAVAEVRAFIALQSHDGAPAFVKVPFATDSPVVAIVAERTEVQGHSASQPLTGVVQPLSLREFPPREEWKQTVTAVTDILHTSNVTKMVLSRVVEATAATPFDPATVLRALQAAYPSAYCYSLDGFVGASPELLIRRSGTQITSRPMAGTIRRGKNANEDQQLRDHLLSSAKDQEEHRILIDDLLAALAPLTQELRVLEHPMVESLANVHHLVTPIEGRVRSADTDVLDLLAAVHPTPAVGGHPTADALELIAKYEDEPRGYYAGAIGWVNHVGDGAFAVALRGAQIDGNTARLRAGGGIVAASDPETEAAETDAKFQVMLRALAATD